MYPISLAARLCIRESLYCSFSLEYVAFDSCRTDVAAMAE